MIFCRQIFMFALFLSFIFVFSSCTHIDRPSQTLSSKIDILYLCSSGKYKSASISINFLNSFIFLILPYPISASSRLISVFPMDSITFRCSCLAVSNPTSPMDLLCAEHLFGLLNFRILVSVFQ